MDYLIVSGCSDILFLSLGTKKINIVEMKKGFARGGHFHNFPSTHIIVFGKIELREEDLGNNIEQIKKIIPKIIICGKRLAIMLAAAAGVINIPITNTTPTT